MKKKCITKVISVWERFCMVAGVLSYTMTVQVLSLSIVC